MKRHAEAELLRWYRRPNKKPLIIRGARQVGKSTLVRQFAAKNKIELIEINLEKTKIQTLRDENVSVAKFLQEIEVIAGKRFSKNSLLFLDEIQEEAKILLYLRYLYEERPEISVVSAGSLLEFLLVEGRYPVPVGRIEYFHLGPCTFTEFLDAIGESILLESVQDHKKLTSNILQVQAMEALKKFYFVGGMPEAVKIFQNTQDMVAVREVQSSILQTYQDDFAKYATRAQTTKIRKVFQSIPLHLGKKVKYSEIDPDEKSREVKKAIELLCLARVLYPCFHSNCSGLPLKAAIDERIYKLFFLDVGLINAMQGLLWTDIVSAGPQILTKGFMAEQFVAQHLAYRKAGHDVPELYYWLRDKSAQKAELDFVIQHNTKIVPIEVKAEKQGKLKSLFYFLAEKKLKEGVVLSLNPFYTEAIHSKIIRDGKTQQVKGQLIHVPLYALELLDTFL